MDFVETVLGYLFLAFIAYGFIDIVKSGRSPRARGLRRLKRLRSGREFCTRCNGTGYLPQYSHVANGICFACLGKSRREPCSRSLARQQSLERSRLESLNRNPELSNSSYNPRIEKFNYECYAEKHGEQILLCELNAKDNNEAEKKASERKAIMLGSKKKKYEGIDWTTYHVQPKTYSS